MSLGYLHNFTVFPDENFLFIIENIARKKEYYKPFNLTSTNVTTLTASPSTAATAALPNPPSILPLFSASLNDQMPLNQSVSNTANSKENDPDSEWTVVETP